MMDQSIIGIRPEPAPQHQGLEKVRGTCWCFVKNSTWGTAGDGAVLLATTATACSWGVARLVQGHGARRRRGAHHHRGRRVRARVGKARDWRTRGPRETHPRRVASTHPSMFVSRCTRRHRQRRSFVSHIFRRCRVIHVDEHLQDVVVRGEAYPHPAVPQWQTNRAPRPSTGGRSTETRLAHTRRERHAPTATCVLRDDGCRLVEPPCLPSRQYGGAGNRVRHGIGRRFHNLFDSYRRWDVALSTTRRGRALKSGIGVAALVNLQEL